MSILTSLPTLGAAIRTEGEVENGRREGDWEEEEEDGEGHVASGEGGRRETRGYVGMRERTERQARRRRGNMFAGRRREGGDEGARDGEDRRCGGASRCRTVSRMRDREVKSRRWRSEDR